MTVVSIAVLAEKSRSVHSPLQWMTPVKAIIVFFLHEEAIRVYPSVDAFDAEIHRRPTVFLESRVPVMRRRMKATVMVHTNWRMNTK